MPRSGCSALHGVNPILKHYIKLAFHHFLSVFFQNYETLDGDYFQLELTKIYKHVCYPDCLILIVEYLGFSEMCYTRKEQVD